MNDWSATHYCSGSESGWTTYLDQSYSEHHFHEAAAAKDENYRQKEAKATVEEEEEEEDLSMVSDASSGPPHYVEDNEDWFSINGYSCYASSESFTKQKEEKEKKKIKPRSRNQQHSYLEDTASSPIYGCNKKSNAASNNEVVKENAMDFSQGFSATHFKRKSALRKHFSFYSSEKSATKKMS